jgi:hypothetical protein
MQGRQVVALLIVVTIIALAFGTAVGYAVFSKTTTTTIATTLTPPGIAFYSTVNSTVTRFTVPATVGTITKLILITMLEHQTAYVSGTCSWVAATVVLNYSTTTEYVLPAVATANNASFRFLNVTLTTVTSAPNDVNSITTDTTITLSTSTSQTQASHVLPWGENGHITEYTSVML